MWRNTKKTVPYEQMKHTVKIRICHCVAATDNRSKYLQHHEYKEIIMPHLFNLPQTLSSFLCTWIECDTSFFSVRFLTVAFTVKKAFIFSHEIYLFDRKHRFHINFRSICQQIFMHILWQNLSEAYPPPLQYYVILRMCKLLRE